MNINEVTASSEIIELQTASQQDYVRAASTGQFENKT